MSKELVKYIVIFAVILAACAITITVAIMTYSMENLRVPGTLDTIRELKLEEITRVEIWLRNKHIILERKRNDDDIRRLLGSIKNIRFSRLAYWGAHNSSDTIIIYARDKRPIRLILQLHLRPGSRIISEKMRSDDLAAIVYDIAKRKGIKPRKQ
jgi:hypothetical protein